MMAILFILMATTFMISVAKNPITKRKYAITFFQTDYTASGTLFNITGYSPDASSSDDGYPLHIFIQGTHPNPQSAWSLTVQEMTQYIAERGVISASIWYNNGVYPYTCNAFHSKAKSMFDLTDPQSALSVLCNSTPSLNIACNHGIVLHGISQGAQLVSLVATEIGDQYKSYIRGINPLAGGVSSIGSCFTYDNLELDQSKIRSRVGLNDGSFCDGAETCRDSQSSLTGYYCPNELTCMKNDGSGWYIIQPQETAAGKANHCYMFFDSQCDDVFDANYYPDCESCDWSMQADFGWLIQRATDHNSI